MKKRVLRLVSIWFMVPIGLCWGQKTVSVDRKAWLEDLEFLEQSVAKIFPDFESAPESELFLQELGRLRGDLDSLSRKEIVYGIQKALAFLKDEGCNILPFQEVLETKILPVSLYPFQDGWYICDAKNKALVGQRVLGMDGRSIDDVYEMMMPYLSADNEHYQERLFAVYGILPDLLRSAGVAGPDSGVELQLSGNRNVFMEAGPLSQYTSLNRGLPNDGYFQLKQKNHENENYWLEYVPNSEAMYIQFQQISNNGEGPSFKKFVGFIAEGIKTGKAKKIILDLRYGGGGNGFKLKPFTDMLRDSEQINQDGNLIVLTSRATRGTLLELASILTLNTQAVIIGEPTGEGPNTVGDIKIVQMPNSKINVSVTKVFWPTSWDFDKRTTLEPHVEVGFTSQNFYKNEDPWLEAAMSYVGGRQLSIKDAGLKEKLSGTYNVQGRKITIGVDEGRFKMQMDRKMKSFFELEAGLLDGGEGILETTIHGVNLYYQKDDSDNVELQYLDWMGTKLDIGTK